VNAQPPKIIFMEDETLFRHIYRDILTKKNCFRVKLAHTPRIAMNLIDAESFDAGIIDIRMTESGSEGFGIIERFRKHNPYGYIEVVTGFSEFKDSAIRKGADKVLIKPLKFKDDKHRLQSGIITKRLQRLKEITGIDLSEMPQSIDISNGFHRWNDIIYKLDVTIDNIEILKTYLTNEANSFGLTQSWVGDLYYNIVRSCIINVIKNGNGGNNMIKESLSRFDILNNMSEDENYSTLTKELDGLINSHAGEFVAIVGGLIVDYDPDIKQLITRVGRNYPSQDRLIHHVVSPQFLKIRGPRLLSKK